MRQGARFEMEAIVRSAGSSFRGWGVAVFVGASLLAGCAGREAQPSAQPYAGLQARPIKALPPERVADLRAGRGAGYALAAELNRYPGPTHVLELKDRLGLTAEQERATRDVFTAMQREAQTLGEQLVELEAQLDAAFAGGKATAAEVGRLTEAIAAVEGRLRAVHLAAHLEQRSLLTEAQVALYDTLRGYSSGGAAGSGGAAHHGQGGTHGGR